MEQGLANKSTISQEVQEYKQIANKKGTINIGRTRMQAKASLSVEIQTVLSLQLTMSIELQGEKLEQSMCRLYGTFSFFFIYL